MGRGGETPAARSSYSVDSVDCSKFPIKVSWKDSTSLADCRNETGRVELAPAETNKYADDAQRWSR